MGEREGEREKKGRKERKKERQRERKKRNAFLSQVKQCPGSSMVKNWPPIQEIQETRFQSLDQEDLLEEGMGIQSSILVWRILWMEGSGRLQSMGSQKSQT